ERWNRAVHVEVKIASHLSQRGVVPGRARALGEEVVPDVPETRRREPAADPTGDLRPGTETGDLPDIACGERADRLAHHETSVSADGHPRHLRGLREGR